MTHVTLVTLLACFAAADGSERGAGILSHTVQDIDGEPVDLERYRGKVLLIVNVASKCGFTPQYEQLQAVFEKYRSQGFVVLGFPSNDFLHQEPGTNEEIKSFCTTKFDVTFDMFAKIHVRGKEQAPLYKQLTSKDENKPYAGGIKWNFTKFLVGRDGRVCGRWAPQTRPDADKVTAAIERELAAKTE